MTSFGTGTETLELELARSRALGASLWRGAATRPDSDALIEAGTGRGRSYRDLNEDVNRLAHGLVAKGIRHGSRVGVVMGNRAEFIDLYYACAKVGAVIVPLNFRLQPDELVALIEHTECDLVVADGDNATRLDLSSVNVTAFVTDADRDGWASYSELSSGQPSTEYDGRVGHDDVLGFMFTAGTTGLPKASIKTHGEYEAAASAFLLRTAAITDVSPGVTYLIATPVFHGGGFTLVASAVYAQWRMVMLESFSVDGLVDAIATYRPTVTWLVPTMIAAAMNAQLPPSAVESLDVVLSAGAPLAPSLREQAEAAWPHITFYDVYGQTEACGPITAPTSRDQIARKPGSLGQPLKGVELCVRTIDGHRAPENTYGEVCYRGTILAQGYYRNPEATTAAFRSGWFHSGDIGYLDEEGCLYLVDRRNDMIITGGENVYPSEVEDAIGSHPDVLEACAFGIPDDVWGERIVAAVVLDPDSDVTDEELVAHCGSVIASYKRPRQIFRLESIPKSPVGKLLRREARAHVLEAIDEEPASGNSVDPGGSDTDDS